MTKEYVIITSSGDWGDEFDLEGFAIFDKETWELIKEGVPDKPFEAYFGSNESVTFEGKDDYLSHLEESSIQYEEILWLAKLLKLRLPTPFTSLTYGLFVINSENY